MAWISIHDTIDGPKLRDLHKRMGCSKFEATGILVFLWQWGLQNADEQGHLINADRDDVERFLHGASSGCSLDEKDIFDALLETGWIDEGEDGLYLHDWSRWQKEWYKYKSKLKKDAERKRKAAEISNKKDTEKTADIPKEIPAEKPVEKPKNEPKAKKVRNDYSQDFNRFWEVYPRRDRKAEAYECFIARTNNGVAPEDMVKAAEAYSNRCRKERTPDKYIMQARTFLGPHLNFMDYVTKEKTREIAPDENPFDYYTEG